MNHGPKILHVNDVASVGSTLQRELQELGLNVELVESVRPMAKAHSLFKVFGFIARWRDAQRISRYARDNGFSLMHIHYFTSALWFVGAAVPRVVHAHGTDVRISRWNVARGIINWFSCRGVLKVFYATPDLQGYVRRYATKDPIFLPNPVDIELFSPRGVVRNPRRIFLYSQLNVPKGADRAIAALAEIRRLYPHVEICAIGWGNLAEEARRAGIQILPKVPRTELPKLIEQSGLVLGQFGVGAVGMSELESLAMGRTVVCNFLYHKAYPEDAPFVQAASVEEIVTAVRRYIENPSVYESLEQQAREWVTRYHSSKAIAKDLAKVYGLEV